MSPNRPRINVSTPQPPYHPDNPSAAVAAVFRLPFADRINRPPTTVSLRHPFSGCPKGTARPPAKFFAALILTPLLAIAAPAPITLPQIQTQAQQGDPEAQARLGEAYLNGNFGIAQDCAQALAWNGKAAQQGNRQARRNLAVQYLNGCGAAFDYPQALALLQQAHRAGDKKSARYLGIIYERGLGVAQDYAQAAAYYQQADQNNDITGQYRLAKLYEQGLGVPRDFARALYLKHTARQDHITAPSFQALGDLYRYGLGVNKNPRESQKWYRLAKQSAAVK